MRVGAVILAAGSSSRLGEPKQFVVVEGRTLLARAMDAAAGCEPVVVVAGRDWERVAEEVGARDVHVARNEEWERGIGSSIRVGVLKVLELAPEVGALVILVCDQPFVGAEQVEALRGERARSGKAMIASRYGDTLGVPVLFDRAMFPKLLELPDDQGAKGVIAAMGNDVGVVEFPRGVVDIDTGEDLRACRKGTEGGVS